MVAVVGHDDGRQRGQIGIEVVNVGNGLLGRQPAGAHEAELGPGLDGIAKGCFVGRVWQHGRLRLGLWRLGDGGIDDVGSSTRTARDVRRRDLRAGGKVGARGAGQGRVVDARGAPRAAVVHVHGHASIAGGLEQQVQRVVAAVDLARLQRRDGLVVHLDVLLAVLQGRHGRRRRRPSQRFIAAYGASRRQRLRAVCGAAAGDVVVLSFARPRALPRVADLVVVLLVGLVAAVLLPLAARGREEALLALTPASHTRRVVRVVDRSQVAAHFAAPTRYAGLVGACVSLRRRARRRCVGARHAMADYLCTGVRVCTLSSGCRPQPRPYISPLQTPRT